MMISTKKLRISMMKWIYTILIKKKACTLHDKIIQSFCCVILFCCLYLTYKYFYPIGNSLNVNFVHPTIQLTYLQLKENITSNNIILIF